MKAFLARDLNGELFLYTPNPPIRFTHSREWIAECKSDTVSSIDQDLFPEVKWEDEEPTEINIEIVNKYQHDKRNINSKSINC